MKRTVLAPLALLCACAATPLTDLPPALPHSSWTLLDPDMADGLERPTLTFDARGASGSTGCNNWFASIDSTRGGVRFETIGATKRACAGPQMDVEQRFLAMLGEALIAEIDGDQLILFGGEAHEIARFDALPPSDLES